MVRLNRSHRVEFGALSLGVYLALSGVQPIAERGPVRAGACLDTPLLAFAPAPFSVDPTIVVKDSAYVVSRELETLP